MKIERHFASIFRRPIPQRSILRSLTKSVKSPNDPNRSFDAKPFESIPGPAPLPVIGNLWRYLPRIGQYNVDRLHENARFNYRQYGELVREVIVGDHCVLHVFNPKHMRIVLLADGAFPERRSHRALKKYRLERPHLYSSGGLFPENGIVWKQCRDQFSRFYLNQKLINQYVNDCDRITSDFFDLIQTKFQSSADSSMFDVPDFHDLLFRWSLEQTAWLALDARMGCLNVDLSENAQNLIKSSHLTHDAVAITETGGDTWQHWPTAGYRQLVRAQDTMGNILRQTFEAKWNEIKNIDQSDSNLSSKTIFQRILAQSGEAEKRDVFGMLVDLFLAGIDTTSFVCTFATYFLATNDESRRRLYDEVMTELPSSGQRLESHHLKQMTYLKACIQETMRLQPVSIGIGRILQKSVCLNHFHVPSGTMVILHNQVASRLEEHFEKADRFDPQRWLPNESVQRSAPVDPFTMLPFGFGPRICLGKKFSEMEMQVLLARLVQRFDWQYTGDGPLSTRTRLINVPDRPVQVKFWLRDDSSATNSKQRSND